MEERAISKKDERALLRALDREPETVMQGVRIMLADDERTRSLRHSLDEVGCLT
jgi:hypothetical protein